MPSEKRNTFLPPEAVVSIENFLLDAIADAEYLVDGAHFFVAVHAAFYREDVVFLAGLDEEAAAARQDQRYRTSRPS